jgi:AsmA protein
VSGSIEAERFELSKLMATLAITDPKLPKSPVNATVTGTLQVDVPKETANLTFATKIDDSAINGRAGLVKFSPPFYTFDINVDQLDADRYLPKSDPKTKPATSAKHTEQSIDLSALKGFNANGTVKVGSLKISNIKASNVRLDIKAANGRVEVSPMSANLYQGSLAGALSANAADSSFGVRQNLSGVNVGPLLRDAAGVDTLEGRGNVAIDVTARGNMAALLKKSLNGTAAVNLSDGAVKGINIAQSIRSAKAKLGTLRGEQVQAADKSQQTDFSSLKATFNIRNGVARNDDLSLQSPLLRVGGGGDIDIGQDKINYVVKATIVGTTKGQGGRGVDELSGVTVPVKVSGPLASPAYGLDFSSMVSDVAKQKAQEALAGELQRRMGAGTAKEGAKEGANKGGSAPADVLKGLFGR